AAGGKKYTAGQQELDFALASDPADSDECDHAYRSENLPELKRLLRGGQYHAVVANPPYIVPRDKQLNDRYRKRFASCHRQYSLAVPFLERIFRLAVGGGYTGQITANSFMKREFGKKLIESFFPSVDLTHVIDTSGAYIPGHGTPTVILFGRHRPPVASTLRTVLGIRGEPTTPDDPARGLVWSVIVAQLDQPGSQSEFVSVGDSPREIFHKHPWSIGGGGAAELKERLEEGTVQKVDDVATSIGFFQDTHADEAFVLPREFPNRRGVRDAFRDQVRGDNVRDWNVVSDECIFFPYDRGLEQWADVPRTPAWGWLYNLKTDLWSRSTFGGGTYRSAGRPWFDYHQFPKDRARTPLSIVFGFVATHNHFALDRGGKVFNRSAPVIKLPCEASEDDHIALVGLLNSSTACFWMKQSFQTKGSSGIGRGVYDEKWESFYEHTSGGLLPFPLPSGRPLLTARLLDSLATRARDFQPASIASHGAPTREALATAKSAAQFARSQMIAAQEELDWECYRLYGLIAAPTERQGASRRSQADEEPAASALRLTTMQPPPLKLGQRAFEIVLARKMAAGETQTTWFERHGSTPITELPAEWPDDYRQLVQRRIDLIASDPNIRLIEQPEYKRRWNTEPWDAQLARALREWLLDRLESYFDFDGRMGEGGTSLSLSEGRGSDATVSTPTPFAEAQGVPPNNPPLADIALVSVAKLADVARQDAEFQQVGELFRDDPAFDVQALVNELVAAECVPLLPVLRYKPSGLIKRGVWERTWDLQRQEDAIDARTKLPSTDPQHLSDDAARELQQKQVGDIPVPTKYDSKDFLDSNLWRLRGKLDVPKERWINFPHCAGPDGTPVIAWAGYDHLQQAKAISAYYVDIQERLGGRDDPRLIPLLAGMLELLPWLKQWHNDPDATFDGLRMGDYFEGFVNDEAKQLGKTIPEIKAWEPPAKTGRKKAAKKKASQANEVDK
ncbi:MAG: BREX-2 system adenine-specific DNA-methyltransferase PglX, partial [Planctomycetaceae bacterium]